MYNLKNVLNFEVTRTIKKKSFWILALIFPLMIAALFGVVYFSGKATDKAAEDLQKQSFSIAVTDQSKLLKKDILNQAKAKITSDKQTSIEAVKNGQLDAYFVYPKDIEHRPIEIYAKDKGLFNNGRYESAAKDLLSQSVSASVNPQVRIVLQDKAQVDSQVYKDGQLSQGFLQVIAPGVFIVLFYILIVIFGNQMLTSTTEEKENRVTEMILTSIQARTLIIGKIISLLILSLLQILIILIPLIAGYLLLRGNLSLPEVDLSNIPFDAGRIAIGAVLFILSFLLFTGLLVAIGSAAPSAKEGGKYFGFVMLLIFGPLYAASLFVSSPEAVIVKVLSFFPLTAPIPLMLRNAVGNLSPLEVILGIVILAAAAGLVIALAIRIFHYGALEYGRRLPLKKLFSGNRTSSS